MRTSSGILAFCLGLQTLDEIPVDPKDVIHVPSLFRSSDIGGDGLPSHGEDLRLGQYQVGSLHPGHSNLPTLDCRV